VSTRARRYCRFHAIEQRNEAQAALSADLRALHVRWANFYSDRLASLDPADTDCASPA